MILNFALVILGIAILVWSADRFTDGAAAVARNFGVSPLIIGLTIIAVGSSAPEIIVSIVAAINEKPEMAVGNALGSNITNIAFVVGATAMIRPLHVESKIIKREFPILFLVTLGAGFLMYDQELSHADGYILLSGLVFYVGWLINIGKQSKQSAEPDLMLEELVDELPETMSNKTAVFFIIIGAVLLSVSSNILVYGASNIASAFGVSDFIIGLTIVAIGTSLPELAASVAGVLKDDHEMAIGNIIGSNIFNFLAVLGIPGAIAAVNLDSSLFYRDYLFALGLTIALFFMAYGFKGPGKINRIEGVLLVSLFIGYISSLYFIESKKSLTSLPLEKHEQTLNIEPLICHNNGTFNKYRFTAPYV